MPLYLLVLCFPFLQQVSADILELEEGHACEPLQGGPGTCTLLSKCRYPGDFKKEHPPICSFRGMEPIICCPKLSERMQVKKKLLQLWEVEEYNCRERKESFSKEDNQISRHVIGGVKAEPREHIHMALIGYGSTGKEWGCGGSIITNRFILSAAHCAKPQLLGVARWARVGELDISRTDDDAKVQNLVIIQRILHPGYKEPQVYNDIALFKVHKDIEFNAWVGPVCLHMDNKKLTGIATVAGWGRVDYAGATSNYLKEADLDIFNDTDCRKLYPNKDNKAPRGIDTKIMFCAGKWDGSLDACSGDSGGPLVVSYGKCMKTQIGITSFGNQCGLPDSPGVYTRVSAYISWIEETVF